MKVLGIDTSTIAIPFAVFDGRLLEDYGVIPLKGKFLEDKLILAHDKIMELVEKYNIDIVILEDVFYGKNFQGTKSTLQILGAMRLGAYKMNATCFLILASKWRKGIIKTRQSVGVKEQAVDYVNDHYNLGLVYDKNRSKTDDDVAECIIMVEGLVWGRYTTENVRVFKK